MHTRLRKPLKATTTAKRRAFACIVRSALGSEEPELDRLMNAAALVVRTRKTKDPLKLTFAINELDTALHRMERVK